MSSGLDAIPNIDHCQQLVLSYAILNHVVLHSALQIGCDICLSVTPKYHIGGGGGVGGGGGNIVSISISSRIIDFKFLFFEIKTQTQDIRGIYSLYKI